MIRKQLNLSTIDGLKEGLKDADRFLTKPFSQIYQAYMIAYFLSLPYHRKVKKSSDAKGMINLYLTNCTDAILKDEMMEMLKGKKIKL